MSTGLPSFIVTLAGLIVAGLALGVSRFLVNTTAVSIEPTGSPHLIFASQWGTFHVSILWWIAIAVLWTWILGRAPFGNWIYATGANPYSARAAVRAVFALSRAAPARASCRATDTSNGQACPRRTDCLSAQGS